MINKQENRLTPSSAENSTAYFKPVQSRLKYHWTRGVAKFLTKCKKFVNTFHQASIKEKILWGEDYQRDLLLKMIGRCRWSLLRRKTSLFRCLSSSTTGPEDLLAVPMSHPLLQRPKGYSHQRLTIGEDNLWYKRATTGASPKSFSSLSLSLHEEDLPSNISKFWCKLTNLLFISINIKVLIYLKYYKIIIII